MSNYPTATLTSSNADALVKIAGMFGSDFPGERAAAAAKADQLLRSAGLTWAQVIAVPQNDWRTMRVFCAERPDALRPREQEFVADLSDWKGPLTERQRSWLVAIYQRLRG